jgi:thiol-disulfide isomerase/thioredoxin
LHSSSGGPWRHRTPAHAGLKDPKPPERTPPAFVTALPEFAARDLAGKTWQLRDLNGKATIVNFWATWRGPCRGEHPAIEELYQRIKGRKDVQVLTFSVDDTLAPVTEYIKEKAYTFLVIHAPELADKLFPYSGLPANFLVNAKGVRTNLLLGLSGTSTRVERLIGDLTEAAK